MKDITTEEAVKQVNDFLEGKKIQYGKGYKNNNNFKAIEKVLNELEKYKKENVDASKIIRKQNLIINAMANEFAEEGYYADRCQSKIEADECDENCQNCIKQYFENRIKED